MVIKEMVHITPYHLDRMLHIYLPDDYEESEARYPVMYMYDGHNLFYNEDATYGKSWGLQEFMRQWDLDFPVYRLDAKRCLQIARHEIRCRYRQTLILIAPA